MTDFIVYISVQQRMQDGRNETLAADARQPGRTLPVARFVSCAVRQRMSVALYRLAEAIHPIGELAGAMVQMSR